MRKLVLDPGHGGAEAQAGSSPFGVRGPYGTLEKDVTLALARRLRGHLEPEVTVALTRDRDVNLPLLERAAIARREGADAFVSLHANGGREGGRGPETWVHPAASPSARALAAGVQQALSLLGGPSRGLKVGTLGVIDPARLGGADGCLVEVDFLSDAGGESRLRDTPSLDRIARALAGAVRGHLARPRYGRGPVTRAQGGDLAPSPCDHRHELAKRDLPPALALVTKHLGPVPDEKVALVLRANAIPDATTSIDVVVHLHGHDGAGAAMSLLDKEPSSGLDFCDPQDASNPYTWRERPTLGILPLGRHDGAEKYSFPAFGTAAGLQELVEFSLAHLATQMGLGEAFTRGRLILTAHSGGGDTLLPVVLGHTDPDEVHLFDATYSSVGLLEKWLRRHVAADAQQLRQAGSDGESVRPTGALRVVYLPGTGTAAQAEACHRTLVTALKGEAGVAHLLCPFYRVEHSVGEAPILTHKNMPRLLGWQLLYSASADTTPRLERPAPPVPCDPPASPTAGDPTAESARFVPSSALDASSDVDFMLSRIVDYESTLAAGRIPRLTDLAPDLLDSAAYEASGRDAELTDHRARLDAVVEQVNAWIMDTTASAVGQIEDAAKRAHLEQVDWAKQGFPGNNEGPDGEARALFAAMAALVPERRVGKTLTYHDVDASVVPVDGQRGASLYPPASWAFASMHDSAGADGVSLSILSSHRSQATQDKIKKSQSNPGAVAQGRSPHTFGLAVDLAMSAGGLSFTETHTHSMKNLVGMYRSPVYKWMYVNGERFGYYPYSWEPWHWEYNPAGFADEFDARTYGRALQAGEVWRRPGRRSPARRRSVPSPRGPRSVALDDRSQLEQQQAVLADARRSLIAAENTRYDQVHFDSGRVNFGIGSWTGGHIPELMGFYRDLAVELGLEQQLFDHFVLPGSPDGQANFDDIRNRFAGSGAGTVLSQAEQAAFRSLGADRGLRAAQDRKMESDVQGAINKAYEQNVYPFIDGYMAAITELAAVILVHVTHQHGASRDLIENVVAKHGGRDATGTAMVDGTLTEVQFLRELSQEVIDRVRPDLKQGVRNRYNKLFADFGGSDTSYYFAPPTAEGQAVRKRERPEGRGRYRTTIDRY